MYRAEGRIQREHRERKCVQKAGQDERFSRSHLHRFAVGEESGAKLSESVVSIIQLFNTYLRNSSGPRASCACLGGCKDLAR